MMKESTASLLTKVLPRMGRYFSMSKETLSFEPVGNLLIWVTGKLEGLVTTPSGKQDKVNVSENGDGTYDIEYTPKELGVYNLDVTFESVPVPGSPFKFKVVQPGPRKVKVHGPGKYTDLQLSQNAQI